MEEIFVKLGDSVKEKKRAFIYFKTLYLIINIKLGVTFIKKHKKYKIVMNPTAAFCMVTIVNIL